MSGANTPRSLVVDWTDEASAASLDSDDEAGAEPVVVPEDVAQATSGKNLGWRGPSSPHSSS
jgi:hypothetical protein